MSVQAQTDRAVVGLNKVTRFYGSRPVLKDVSLALYPGSVTLLAGPNGAGKSTLLRTAAGLLRPNSGRVTIDGSVGFLGHQTFIYPAFSALENLAFWARLHGLRPFEAMGKDDDPLRAALAAVDLLAFAEERSGSFSRGMTQRLSLARLFLLRPDVLLLDEPGTGLDTRSTLLLRQQIRTAADRGAAVLWVTHSPEEDAAFADRVAVLEKKQLRLYLSVTDYRAALATTATDRPTSEASGQDAQKTEPAAREGAYKRPSAQEQLGTAQGRETGLFTAASAVTRKDIRLTLGRGTGLLQAMLLGVLLIFIFSLSLSPGETMSPQGSAAIFWTASAFCQVLIFSTLYAHEENHGQRLALLTAPFPIQGLWLGKALAGFCLLLTAQALFLPATVVFLSQGINGSIAMGAAMLFLVDAGIVALGSLLGALSQGQSAKESMLSLVLFPLSAPLFLAGIRIGAAFFGGPEADDPSSWFGIAAAFDAIFAAAALILFPHIYSAEE